MSDQEKQEMLDEIRETVAEFKGKADFVLECSEEVIPAVVEVLEKEKISPVVGQIIAKLFVGGFSAATTEIRKGNTIKEMALLAKDSYDALVEAGFSKSEALQIIISRK